MTISAESTSASNGAVDNPRVHDPWTTNPRFAGNAAAYRTNATRPRHGRNAQPGPAETTRPQTATARRGFDTLRPDWLNRPDFTPVDTSQPLLTKPEDAYIDVTRPELWMNEDGQIVPDAQHHAHHNTTGWAQR